MSFVLKGKTYIDMVLLIAGIQFTFGGEPGISLLPMFRMMKFPAEALVR